MQQHSTRVLDSFEGPDETTLVLISTHSALVTLAHDQFDRADALLRLLGATPLVLDAYRSCERAFYAAQVHWWARVAAQRAERTLELM